MSENDLSQVDSGPPGIKSTETLPVPVATIIASASKAKPGHSAYSPSESDTKLAAVLFESNCPSFTDLANQAGISRTTLWRIVSNPDACAWLVENSTKAAGSLLGAVHARLAHLALTSPSPYALELYMRRFDPHFTKSGADNPDMKINAELAVVTQMTSAELEKFISLKRQKAGIIDIEATPSQPSEADSSPG